MSAGVFRIELELRSVNRRIPVEAVLDPAAYFAGACRFLADLADTHPCRGTLYGPGNLAPAAD